MSVDQDAVVETPVAEPSPGSLRTRLLLVGVGALVLAAVGVGYSVYAGSRASESAHASGDAVPASDPGLYLRDADGYVVVQEGEGADAVVEGEEPAREGTGLDCFRFYAAGGTAVCLRPQGGLTPMTTTEILDDDLHVVQSFEFDGVPTRARESPSGRMIAWTVFVTGDSYASTNFSTRTGMYDLETGYLVDSIEDLQLYIDGERIRRPDVNFWGVTFTEDDNTFYATVATGGRTYLVEGDVEKWTAHALRENLECPSLSPDGTRLAFKKRVNDSVDDPWRLYVLDLATMQEHPVAEDRNIDDQAAWLDDGTLAYAVGDDVWSVPADGSGGPKLIAPGASSPVLVGG